MICVNAPGNATRRTAKSSRIEKWVPDSEHKQDHADLRQLRSELCVGDEAGVNGPTTIPAKRYPTSGGKRSRTASNPPTNAKARLTAMVAISGTS